MKPIKSFVILFITILLLGACGKENENQSTDFLSSPYKRTEFLMGTVVTIKIYDKNKEDVLNTVFARIETLANSITVNEEGSEVDDINNQAGLKAVKVSDDIYRLVEAGLQYSDYSTGGFDVTIGPLTQLWHIGFPDEKKPTQAEIDDVLPLIDYKKVELNEEEKTVFLKEKNMKLDLGAIAKGFITDEVVAMLDENNVQSAIIDLGGNIFVKGENPAGRPWEVGVQDPFSTRGETVGKIKETERSVVTSGVYERFLEVDGEKYHHILSSENGYSVNNDIAGITIISDKSVDGDGLSTSIFIKGIEEGLKAVEKLEGIEAIFVSKDKKVYITSGLKDNFELINDQFSMGN